MQSIASHRRKCNRSSEQSSAGNAIRHRRLCSVRQINIFVMQPSNGRQRGLYFLIWVAQAVCLLNCKSSIFLFKFGTLFELHAHSRGAVKYVVPLFFSTLLRSLICLSFVALSLHFSVASRLFSSATSN